MNESPDIVEQALRSSMKRRDFLTKAAAAGAITWAAPVILSGRAYADEVTGGTPKCRPKINQPVCSIISCSQGQKNFPGFTITTSPSCPCNGGSAPITCIKITNVSNCGSMALVAYGNGTDCSPGGPTNVLTNATGSWVCFDSTQPVFFGPQRNANGSINNLSTCTFTADVSVWSGCPSTTRPGSFDFDCQTFHLSVSYQSGSNASATCTTQSSSSSDCAGQTTPPCCSPNLNPKPFCCP